MLVLLAELLIFVRPPGYEAKAKPNHLRRKCKNVLVFPGRFEAPRGLEDDDLPYFQSSGKVL